jgi:glutathione-specific gamma-glutamylcyclotransferase
MITTRFGTTSAAAGRLRQTVKTSCQTRPRQKIALTADLVALTKRHEPDHGPDSRFTPASKMQLDELAERLVSELGSQDLWVFAYGSLIWKPPFSFSERLRATAYGWHRSFCIELTDWRGSPSLPGLMLALERGGQCEGVAYRLCDGMHPEQIGKLIAREITTIEDISMVRWSTVWTSQGPLRALMFWAGPQGPGISCKLPLPQIAWTLARACGHGGSGAEYLYHTVVQLEHLGIRDSFLWRLQQLVAAEILTLYPEHNNLVQQT